MTLEELITSLRHHCISFPGDKENTQKVIAWIEKYGKFAFVKENLEGHIVASIWITNKERTKVLMMYHKRFQMWTQFGGHCDGEIDVKNVALREFHEESGVLEEPIIVGNIFSVQLWDIAERISSSGMWQPRHVHFDILYLGIVDENVELIRQESEVDDIQWFLIDGIEKYISDTRMLAMINKIRNLH